VAPKKDPAMDKVFKVVDHKSRHSAGPQS